MVNKKFWLGILVMALVFGMTAVDSAFGLDTTLNGRWKANARSGFYIDDIVEYTFLAGNYEILKEYGPGRIEPMDKGTYTTDDKGNITLKVTHIYFDDKWYSKDEGIALAKSAGATDAEIKEFTDYFNARTVVYSITSGLVLQLFEGSKKYTYYKQ